MQRATLPVLVVAAAVAVAGVAGAGFVFGSGTAGAADDAGTDRTITVTAEGTAEAAPDQAVVRVAVRASGDDPAAVRDDLTDGADDLREELDEAGVDEDAIETTDYEIRQDRRPPREEDGDQPEYRGAHQFQVTLDDVDEVGTVVDAAVDAGAEIQHVTFTLSAEKRADLRDEALENAMADADRQAETLAEAGDLRVTAVSTIDATDRQYRPVTREAAAYDSGGDGGTSIDTGDVSVSTTIRVTYNATTG